MPEEGEGSPSIKNSCFFVASENLERPSETEGGKGRRRRVLASFITTDGIGRTGKAALGEGKRDHLSSLQSPREKFAGKGVLFAGADTAKGKISSKKKNNRIVCKDLLHGNDSFLRKKNPSL